MLKALAILLALTGTASAQTWTCTANGVACQPGSAGCICAETPAAPPVVAAPSCPFGTYWTGSVCAAVPQAPVYVPPPVYYPHPWWHGPGHP